MKLSYDQIIMCSKQSRSSLHIKNSSLTGLQTSNDILEKTFRIQKRNDRVGGSPWGESCGGGDCPIFLEIRAASTWRNSIYFEIHL